MFAYNIYFCTYCNPLLYIADLYSYVVFDWQQGGGAPRLYQHFACGGRSSSASGAAGDDLASGGVRGGGADQRAAACPRYSARCGAGSCGKFFFMFLVLFLRTCGVLLCMLLRCIYLLIFMYCIAVHLRTYFYVLYCGVLTYLFLCTVLRCTYVLIFMYCKNVMCGNNIFIAAHTLPLPII